MSIDETTKNVALVQELMRVQRPLVILTGAGMSADYGVPTFRGEGSLWRGQSVIDVLTPEAYQRNPREVWGWHLELRERLSRITDPYTHQRLAEWSRHDNDVYVITQNIDGLHERVDQARLLRLHGSVWSNRCAACQHVREDLLTSYVVLPRCPRCRDGRERPNVVWYGESLDRKIYKRAERLVMSAKLLLVIGTSGYVYPAAQLMKAARQRGVTLVQVNPDTSAVESDIELRLGAAEALSRILV